MTEICAVVITAPDPEWLADFTRRLVDDHLCAAGHVTTVIRSLYQWRGESYDRPEGHVTLHTRTEHVPAIIDRVNTEHPYEVPCVVSTQITAASAQYKAWVIEQTKPE